VIKDFDKEKIEIFCRKWGIKEFSLFGSILRNDFNSKSDVDVLVSFDSAREWSYWDWPEMLDDLKSIFGREADIVVKEGLNNPFRRREILSTREVIYAQ